MTNLGYSPTRVRLLNRAAHRAADTLGELACSDPAAEDALVAVALTRHNLEVTWIPLLDRIEASDAMRSWHTSGYQLGTDGPAWHELPTEASRFSGLTDETLLELLRQIDDAVPADRSGSPQLGDVFGNDREALVATITRRLYAGDSFASELMAALPTSPVIALLLADGAVPVVYRSTALRVILTDVWWDAGYEMDKLGAAANALLTSLLYEPDAALATLGDPAVQRVLAEWPALDQEVVGDFVHNGLVGAVHSEPADHARGVAVLIDLVALANTTPFDHHGFGDGLSMGVAASIGAYAPSFIDSIRMPTSYVHARSAGPDGDFDVTLGSYEEVLDLFGSVMRNSPAAQGLLGSELAILTRAAVEAGEDVPSSIRIDTVAEFAELIRDAAQNESAENMIAASARRSALLDTAALVGFGASAALAIGGASGALGRVVIERGIADLSDHRARQIGDESVRTPNYAAATHDTIVVSVARQLANDPGLRRELGVDPSGSGWQQLGQTLSTLDELARRGDDGAADADRLLREVESRVRDLGAGAHLDGYLHRPAVHALTQERRPAD